MAASAPLYKSTRGGESGVPFERVLLSAYAADGGLYVPEVLPVLRQAQLRAWAGFPLPLVCAEIVSLFTGLPVLACRDMCTQAFATFNGGQDPPLPLRCFPESGLPKGCMLLETGEGPTLAFKDIGQQVVARLLNHYLGARGQRATVLVETSGDTGPAAVEAVRTCPHVDIFVCYPHGRVSPVQELQLVTVDAPNVTVFRTEGNTDEQAEMLKAIFLDAEFCAAHNVVSINSINWARIMAQCSYYVWCYLQLSPRADAQAAFFVPTGAFGNAMGGYLAQRMGLPISRIVCATNANDIVHRTLSTGDMTMGANVPTISPAMDIQFAYNLERVLFYALNENAAELRGYMRQLLDAAGGGGGGAGSDVNGGRRGALLDPLLVRRLRAVFDSCAVSDAQTLEEMRRMHAACGYVLCPHSAIAAHAARRMQLPGPQVVVLTAHPAKFEEAVQQATGAPPVFPPAVERLRTLPQRFTWMRAPADGSDKIAAWGKQMRAAVEARAAERARAAGQGQGPQSKL
eukprot:g936.t1